MQARTVTRTAIKAAVLLIIALSALGQQTPSATVSNCNPSQAGTSPTVIQRAGGRAIVKIIRHIGPQISKGTGGVVETDDLGAMAADAAAKKPASCPPASLVTSATAAHAAVVNNAAPKALELCPPKSTRVEGQPYCITADNTLIDIVRIPAPKAAPAETTSK